MLHLYQSLDTKEAVPMNLFVVIVPILAGASLGWALSRRPVEVLDRPDAEVVCGLRRRARLASLAGLLLGVAGIALLVALAPHFGDHLGIGAALTPMVGIGVLLIALCLAELTTPSGTGPVRSASLSTRRLGDYVSPAPVRLAVAGPLLLTVMLLTGWALGDPDDAGRAGRALATTCGATGQSHGPWPGSFYAIPMLIGLAIILVTSVVTLRSVVQRSRSSADDQAGDDRVRAEAVRRVLLVTASVGFIATVPVAVLMGAAVFALDCRPGWYPALGVACVLAGTIGALLGAGCLGSAMAAPRVVRRDLRSRA